MATKIVMTSDLLAAIINLVAGSLIFLAALIGFATALFLR